MGNTSSFDGKRPGLLWGIPLVAMGKTSTMYGKHHGLQWETPKVYQQLMWLLITRSFYLLLQVGHDSIWGFQKRPQVIVMMTAPLKKQVNISQSNELTEAAYYLPLQAKRVLWLCLMQCYPMKDDPDSVSPVFTVTVADYQKFFKVSVDTASTDVKKGVTALADSSVVFYPKDGEFEEVKRPWLAEAGLKKGRGKWQIEFNYKVMPYLMGLTSQFTTYSLYDCGKINSVRVIRLYESLCQYRSSGVWITTQEWLSERFMLPESQRSNFAEMKRTFINPALKKINANTPLKAAMTQNDDGRLVFTIVDAKN